LETPAGPEEAETSRLTHRRNPVLTAWNVILLLKLAVAAVTVLLLTSLVALARGNYRLHGRINIVFFILTLAALLGLEGVARFAEPEMFRTYFRLTNAESALAVHLTFSIPSAALLPLMLYTGLKRRRTAHITMAILFSILWTGTFITGLFFLPHTPP
jgi:uncharacterized membrane protein YozB (DUF420 family)